MERKTGVVVPLGALYSEDCPTVGDFLSLKPFADFCEKSGIEIIQLLPVNDTGSQSSPYSAVSAYALHPMFIRLEALPEFADAKKHNRAFATAYKDFINQNQSGNRFDYTKINSGKIELLHLLYAYILKKINSKSLQKNQADVAYASKLQLDMQKFTYDNPWVVHYAVYKDLKDAYGQASWKDWDESKKNMTRTQIELRWNNRALRESHNFFIWCQMRAYEQFLDAANYIRQKGLILKGDIPILINEDSVACWAWPEFFDQHTRVGSPPDFENPTGQRWGFPSYKWSAMGEDNFSWWKTRLNYASKFFSAFRLDHVIGFFRMWVYPEEENTAALGHADNFSTMEKKILEDCGFSEERLEWLSKPHIQTELVESITGDRESATEILEKLCYRIDDQELWKFKEDITSDSVILGTPLCDDETKNSQLHSLFQKKWLDRCLLEIEEGQYIPTWAYKNSSAWATLDEVEKQILEDEFDALKEKDEEIWIGNGPAVLAPILSSTKMQPCGEDLGINLPGMQKTLENLKIMALRVVRWTRFWDRDNQPYEEFNTYPDLSVTSVSVHDSPTLRQWWNEEKQSVYGFFDAAYKNGCPSAIDPNCDLNPDAAEFVLSAAARTSSDWFINPLQDYLYMEESFYAPNPCDERINVPGTVNEKNWTYRLNTPLEELLKNESLSAKIKKISEIHKDFGF